MPKYRLKLEGGEVQYKYATLEIEADSKMEARAAVHRLDATNELSSLVTWEYSEQTEEMWVDIIECEEL